LISIYCGPARPVLGQPYPYDLYVHCGGEYAAFAGGTWRTSQPPGDQGTTVDASGIATYTGYLAGWMTQLGPDTAVFAVAGTTGRFTYRRTTEEGPLCA
jgi:hypothetical protein